MSGEAEACHATPRRPSTQYINTKLSPSPLCGQPQIKAFILFLPCPCKPISSLYNGISASLLLLQLQLRFWKIEWKYWIDCQKYSSVSDHPFLKLDTCDEGKAIKSWTCCSETWDCSGLLRGNPGVISWITHSWQFSEFYVLPFERILTGVKLVPL